MKKITLLLTLFFTSSIIFGQVLISEDFEGGLTVPTGWVNNDINGGGNVWTFENTGQTPAGFTTPNSYLYDPAGFSGSYAIFNSDAYGGGPEEAALESPTFDCSTLTTIKLSYNHFYLSGYSGYGYVEVYNGSSWITVATYDDAAAATDGYLYGSEIIDVSTELAGVSNAQVRFRWVGDYSWWWGFDNVVVQQPTVSAPDAVIEPSPADEATDVPLVQDDIDYPNKIYFSWTEPTTGDPATSYRLVLGTENPPVQEFNNFPNGDFIYNISFDTTYYWQIIAVNIGGETASEIWSFTTEADPTASIDEVTNDTFSHFYNKDTDVLTLESSSTPLEHVEIFNILGQQVINNNLSLNRETINMSDLKDGIYLTKVTINGNTKTIKVLKQ
ncbi:MULTISPECIES: T9SS type A sorting domain-containing protein [Gaetbulibacter]|jgi:hypothetical protein|uniref:Secretion system C-terminal sorting domain-containing protein n=1 Tax=Gaetbulibacter jejuensis TaxID=584607 RepID=A0ABP3VAC2_9FLAO|nr:T9SS type A sorting domain-containing protein [Gaetbulibacter sp. NE]